MLPLLAVALLPGCANGDPGGGGAAAGAGDGTGGTACVAPGCSGSVSSGTCEGDVLCNRKRGEPCYKDSQCASGHCADKIVCCDTDCDGTCQACRALWTGVADGTCAGVMAGKNPHNYCLGSACDGHGACLPGCAVQVALGTYHTCARKQDGTLWCWGYNAYGQLGDGTLLDRSTPVQVAALGGTVVEVVLGWGHTCARKEDGTLWCWGRNAYGQLGDGTLLDRSSPVQVTALGSAAAGVALGTNHTCARKQDGTLWCWGYNDFGQLGDGTLLGKSSPVQVTALGSAVAGVALGSYHTCAIDAGGAVWCWGLDNDAQLGDGATGSKPSPVQVTAVGGAVVEVALGISHTCARKQNGTLWCWGDNLKGQLGDGTKWDNPSPVQVIAMGNDTIDVALGSRHTCALKQDGTLWCWGDNEKGQLGDGTVTGKLKPVQVTDWSPWSRAEAPGDETIEVALGSGHTCALQQDHTLWCWGDDDHHQLGSAGSPNSRVPAPVPLCP